MERFALGLGDVVNPNNSKSRLDSLDIIRIFAAVLITLYHMDYPNNTIQPIKTILFNGFGNYAVTLFIVLSGFLSSYNYNYDKIEIKDIKNNVKRKVLKVYPLHFVTLIAMLLYKNVTHAFEPTDSIAFILQLCMIQAFCPIKSIYYSYNKLSWYLGLFILFATIEIPTVYVLKRLLKSYLLKVCFGVIVLLIQMMWFTAFQEASISHWLCYVCPWFRILDYTLGVVSGLIFLDRNNNGHLCKNITKNAVMHVVLMTLALASILLKAVIPFNYYKIAYSVSCCFVIYFMSVYSEVVCFSAFIKKAGQFSFDWYMTHQIIIGVISIKIKNELIAIGGVFVCTLVVVVIWNRFYWKIYDRHFSVRRTDDTRSK